ncbi:MAG: helix-turn-helix domain-containing protein [Candidatus Micrarchaeia archaeon]
MKRLLLNEVEVCNLLNIKPRTISSARIPKVKLGRMVLYDVDDILRWVESSRKSGATVSSLIETFSEDESIKGISNLALVLGLPYRFVFTQVKKGKIPVTSVNGDYIFNVKDLKNWIRQAKEKWK